MIYQLIITFSAYDDINSIKEYIGIHSKEAANKYIDRIFDKLDSLKTLPFRGSEIKNPIFDYAKARYLICLNHVAIYQVDEANNIVYIVRVLSHFQDWKNIVNKDLLKKFIVINEDEDLMLTRINESMSYDIYRNSLDEDNRIFVPDEVFESLEEANEVVNQIIDNYSTQDGPFVYAVIRKEDYANLGYVQLIKKDDIWEIGYHIAKMYTNKGYATKAVKLLLDYIHKYMNINEIYGTALSSNEASLKVLQKCGFITIYEGKGFYQGKRRKIIKAIKKI